MKNVFANLHKPTTAGSAKFSDRQQRIHRFLSQNRIGIVSTISPDMEPHGSVVYFSIDDQFNISFITKSGTRKADNLVHNDRIHMTVFEPLTQAVAQIRGRAHEITDGYALNRVAAQTLGTALDTSESGTPPLTKLEDGGYIGFTITPAQITLAVYARPDPGSFGDLFESIESFDLLD
jgi:hypothetical protein